MAIDHLTTCCCGPGETCSPSGVSRRAFMALSAAVGAAGTMTALAPSAAAAELVPAGLAALADRGVPTEYTGAALPKIGMPVGGITCGQVYLSGDGRLWVWDILNPDAFPPGGNDGGGTHYASPMSVGSNPATVPFRTGFVLRTESGGTVLTRALDATGFGDVRFVGRYPIGTVRFAAGDSPVAVTLDAFSPFVPLATDDSSYPAVVMAYTVTNTSAAPVKVSIAGFSENPVCLTSATQLPTRLRATTISRGDARYVDFGAADPAPPRADIVFEDWERDTYAPWTTTGDAFGTGPVVAASVPDYMKRFDGPAQQHLNCSGTRLVTSHNYRLGSPDPDSHTGTLVSPVFTISRKFVAVSVGGGRQSATAVRVVVAGQVVASASGNEDERVMVKVLDVSAHEGKEARIEVVDQLTGAWAHVNVDLIVFTDRADTVVEDWEQNDFAGWTVSGTAFGPGPVGTEDLATAPAMFRRYGDLNVNGTRFVTSFNWRTGGEDGPTGSLLSAPFRLTRRFVSVSVGGGNHPGTACVDVLVNGVVVASATGRNSEPLEVHTLDVAQYEGRTAQIRITDQQTGAWGHINCGAIHQTDANDILFEDWNRTSYAPWTVTGTAFGPGPRTLADMSDFWKRAFGEITEHNVSGDRFVTSFDIRRADSDTPTGTLTSPVFTISRRYVTAWVGGGNHPGKAAVQVLVGGQVVAQCTGQDMEPMQAVSMDVSRYHGRQAQVRIVDEVSTGWGHVNCDRIVFSDRPVRSRRVPDRYDGGGFALAAFDPTAVVRPSIADWSTPAAVLDSGAGPGETDGAKLAGAVTSSVTLQPGETKTLRFALGWFFPQVAAAVTAYLTGSPRLRRHYVTRFAGSAAVIDSLASNLGRLDSATRLWVKTFYGDSTLPHWFCERTLANASTLATGTCYRFDNGRFYGFEGIYCCAGTCQHVWNYAQSVARLFPDLERDTRERVDLGLALRANGEMQNRGEHEISFIDGQCGTILRIYREHQMTADSAFLNRVWPDTRLALNFLVNNRDVDSNGIVEGVQHNTLDSKWYGEVPWISGLYVAALRAGAAMATEVGDTTSAQRFATLADRGSAFLDNTLWNGTYGYFIHRKHPDEAYKDLMNSNRGVFIDQMYGELYASQLALPRVFAADKAKIALGNIYRHSFLPDSSNYSRISGIPGNRVYSVAGEPGVVMCTWPNGGASEAGTDGALLYFNEVWTGQEYEFAAHLMTEGMVAESLAVTRAMHDRYSGTKRNPYNEIECGDHYARAMMSHAVFLAACGYEYHGPKGHLGFAPRLTPENFQAAFTAAEGWGSYRQTRGGSTQTAVVEVRYGRLRLASFAQVTSAPATAVTVTLNGTAVPATLTTSGTRAVVTLTSPVTIGTGHALQVTLTL